LDGNGMVSLVTERAALQVLRAARQIPQTHTAWDLNNLLDQWPKPSEAVAMLKSSPANCPKLFQDVSLEDVAYDLYAFIVFGTMKFPVFLMPVKAMEVWDQHPHAAEVRERLLPHGLDVQLNVDGPATWLKGHWCVLCDMKLRFVTEEEFTPSHRALALEHDDAIRLLGIPLPP